MFVMRIDNMNESEGKKKNSARAKDYEERAKAILRYLLTLTGAIAGKQIKPTSEQLTIFVGELPGILNWALGEHKYSNRPLTEIEMSEVESKLQNLPGWRNDERK